MDKRILSFLLMAFGIAWGIAAIGIALGVRADSGVSYTLVAGACMLAPAIAALVQQRLIDRGPWAGLGLALKSTKWPLLAATVLVGMAIVPLSLGAIHVLGESFGLASAGKVSISSERLLTALEELVVAATGAAPPADQLETAARVPAPAVLLIALLGAVLMAFTVNLPFMLGEELGWRGYLWQLSAHWSGLQRVLFTGTVWGLWHAPLIAVGHNYPGHPIAGIGMMTLFCVLLSFLFDWTRTRSNSVWSSCVLHGIINGSAGSTMLFAWDGHPLVGSIAGVAGLLAIAVLVVAVIALDRTYRIALGRGEGPGILAAAEN